MLAAVRALSSPPADVVDPGTGAPRFGSYRGPLPRVELGALAGGRLPRLRRLVREKRWMYAAISADPLLLGIAVVDLGYLANAFAFVFDRRAGRMVADHTALGPGPVASVNELAGAGHHARFAFAGNEVAIQRGLASSTYGVRVRMRDLRVDAELDASAAPDGISVIAPIAGGVVNTTEKRALLAVRGEASVGGHTTSLEGGFGGYDYTHGLLARHTAWRWAFAQGRTTGGEPVALNLVEGFVGEAECALWLGGDLHPLAEGRFSFDARDPEAPWQVRTADGSVDLRFQPGGAHREEKNFGIVASRFLQPMGVFSGTVRIPGRAPVELRDVLGVTEDQDVLW
jgi:hypothetical protein